MSRTLNHKGAASVGGDERRARTILEEEEVAKRRELHAADRSLSHDEIGFRPDADARNLIGQNLLHLAVQLEPSGRIGLHRRLIEQGVYAGIREEATVVA